MILFGTKVGRIICDYFINFYVSTGSTFKNIVQQAIFIII